MIPLLYLLVNILLGTIILLLASPPLVLLIYIPIWMVTTAVFIRKMEVRDEIKMYDHHLNHSEGSHQVWIINPHDLAPVTKIWEGSPSSCVEVVRERLDMGWDLNSLSILTKVDEGMIHSPIHS